VYLVRKNITAEREPGVLQWLVNGWSTLQNLKNLSLESLTYSASKMLKIQSDLTRITKDLFTRTDAGHNASVADVLTEFAVGAYVLATPRSTPANRLHAQWTGLYQVISCQKGQYKFMDLITNKFKMYHSFNSVCWA
jgi:phage/plasmid-associated DNA primase